MNYDRLNEALRRAHKLINPCFYYELITIVTFNGEIIQVYMFKSYPHELWRLNYHHFVQKPLTYQIPSALLYLLSVIV